MPLRLQRLWILFGIGFVLVVIYLSACPLYDTRWNSSLPRSLKRSSGAKANRAKPGRKMTLY